MDIGSANESNHSNEEKFGEPPRHSLMLELRQLKGKQSTTEDSITLGKNAYRELIHPEQKQLLTFAFCSPIVRGGRGNGKRPRGLQNKRRVNPSACRTRGK